MPYGLDQPPEDKEKRWWVGLLPTINFQFVFGIDRRRRGYLGHRDLWWSYGSSHPQVSVRPETVDGQHEAEYRQDCGDHSRDIAPYLDVGGYCCSEHLRPCGGEPDGEGGVSRVGQGDHRCSDHKDSGKPREDSWPLQLCQPERRHEKGHASEKLI